jgi:nucleotide-binding universal stress UspA family protein
MLMTPQFFLPLLTYPDRTSVATTANAVALAGHYQATLHAAAIAVTMPPITNPWSSLLIDTDTMVREAESASEKHAAYLLNSLRTGAASAGIALETETVVVVQPDAGDAVAGMARHYDLTLLQGSAAFEAVTEAVLFGSGRPVLLLPDQAFSGQIEHVAIAWDGSRAAARSVGDAALFLAGAKQVSILHVMDEKSLDVDVSRRIFDVLKARGITAEPYPIHTYERPIGDTLQAKAGALGADLLVMGGFGHSRVREFVLGGATSDVLSAVQLPVLMSH